jgi:hypothetical protein
MPGWRTIGYGRKGDDDAEGGVDAEEEGEEAGLSRGVPSG